MSNHSLSRRQMLSLLGGALGVAAGATLLSRYTDSTVYAAPTEGGMGGPPAGGNPAGGTTVALCDLPLTLVDQAWNAPKRNLAVGGKPLTIAGRTFATGIGTHARSLMILRLEGGARRLRATVGVDDGGGALSSVRFVVTGDKRELWNSGMRKKGDAALPVDVDVTGVRWLTLEVQDGGDGNAEDHADWAEAQLEGVTLKPSIATRLPEEKGLFLPGRQWVDTDGKRIQAHGGGIMRSGDKWWWYGEDRSRGYIAIGTSAYSSTDLLTWKNEGIVLPRSAYNQVHGDQTLCERPKVMYNPVTRQFVMWFHYDRAGYGDSRAGVAVADRPEGPFRYLGAIRPIESSTYRDQNIWADDDGHAYAFYAGEENATMHVVRLNREWTAPEAPMVEGKTWNRILVGKQREAPAPFKHDGKYYLITSACTGWAPNAADLAVADNPLGPYTMTGNPCVGPDAKTTFRSQSTFILPTPGAPKGNFLYMGDIWKSEALEDSRYVWLPFHMENGRTTLNWTPSWALGPHGVKA